MKWVVNENIEALERLKKNVNLFTIPKISKIIAITVISDIKTKYENEKDVKGKKFAPLKPSTIKQKERQGKVPYRY